MTAATNIRYMRVNMCSPTRRSSAIVTACKAIGANDYTFTAFLSKLYELHCADAPTVVEITGIENDYAERKSQIDSLLKLLSVFSKHHRLVKFAVRIGNMRYVI